MADMTTGTVHLFNFMAHPLRLMDPEKPERCVWEVPSSGDLFLDYAYGSPGNMAEPELPNLVYQTSAARTISVRVQLEADYTRLKPDTDGHRKFCEVVEEARKHPDERYDLLCTVLTAKFLAHRPQNFDQLPNIRILSCGQGPWVVRDGLKGTPAGYTGLRLHPWNKASGSWCSIS